MQEKKKKGIGVAAEESDAGSSKARIKALIGCFLLEQRDLVVNITASLS